jgi:MFS transporter, DHA1 family, inner membrane transport protein
MTSMNGRSARLPIQIYALTAAAFAIGTTEFVIMGILPEIANDLAVSIPTAGLLVTGYALGVVLAAPIMTLGTRGIARKPLLMGLMGLFILGNVIGALAPNYTVLMISRVVSAMCHATYFGVGAVVAAGLVPPERRASAIALMFSGLALANILGVPAGTAIGQLFGWRATFAVVSFTGVIAFVATAILIHPVNSEPTENILDELATLRRPKLWAALGTTVFGFGGLFAILTFIAPILRDITGIAPEWVGAVLLVFGVGLTFGNILGGRLADKNLELATIGILSALALANLGFYWIMASALGTTIFMFVWGVCAFATTAPLQTRIVLMSPHAPALASSLNIAAFNLGNAGGAYLGSEMIRAGYSYPSLTLAGACVCAFGVVLARLSR